MSKKTQLEQRGDARVQLPERHQREWRDFSLDEYIREDALVRTVVSYVDSLDLSELYQKIKSTKGNTGRNAIDPRILFSLWLFGTLEGVNSGRRLATLATRDLAYMWICGDVSVNYHTLCDFRTQHGDLLERILVDSIAVLHRLDLVRLETIAQDGMRVRASAGSGSFRRQKTIEEARETAESFLQDVLQRDESSDDDDDSDKRNPREKSARQRAARERVQRLEEASLEMEDMQERYQARNKKVGEKNKCSEPRVSTTDPESRRMKMGDNGFRPAFNVQFSNDADALLITGIAVSNSGSDAGLLEPMYNKFIEQHGVVPESYIADGGFSKKQGVTALEKNGTKFYGPLYNEQKLLEAGEDPYQPKPKENKHYTAFRERMGTDEAKAIYKKRAAAAEFPNAICRNQGLSQFSVRGKVKAKAQVTWHALANNLRRFMNLTTQDEQTYLEVLMTS